MKPTLRTAALATGVSLALAASTTSAALASGEAAEKPGNNGQKQKILEVVHEYFSERDKGWLTPKETNRMTLESGSLASGPAKLAANTSRIAREVQEERGLHAEEVITGIAKDTEVRLRGHKATVTTTAGTGLKWNDKELGESTYSDPYIIELERDGGGKDWRIAKVSYAPIPDTDAGETAGGTAASGKAEEAAGQVGTKATKTFDRDAAAAYARYWSGQETLKLPGLTFSFDRYNSDYDRAKQDNNCTNFVSQAMHAGGWEIEDGIDPDNEENWDYDLTGPYGPSKTWSVAYKMWSYAGDPKRGTNLTSGSPDVADIWNLRPGDLLFADWDPNKVPDGKIDHAMVISGTYTSMGFTEPTYSQNSAHRSNIPLSIGIKIATAPVQDNDGDGQADEWPAGQGRSIKFYPVRVKDSFETD
ncbi:hypothetical protein G5C51_31840 [Streptomyces sp. A7024]|uniref:Putative amidase domain-containing protein n=1 Tax=Streptomyces coryli TaxID=1128680 RepID=A0A6G4UAX5_9ACTN|nr:amidase domain-containing protein [Streptomyces coryli]NGN68477.1 hypothetical protein [Streptomyces coryli]